MRTTVNLKDELVARAREMTQIHEKTALIHAGLEALISRAVAERLAKLGGSDKKARVGRRRRPTR
jgi:Arc/MetJ family transcription regulator